MPKKQKTSKKSVLTDVRENGATPPAIAKADAPSPVKAAKKASKPTARKTAPARQTKAAKAAKGTHRSEPSADQVQLRAYFISEHRQRLGVAGDHHSDWLEARRQLLLEAGKK